MTDLPADAQTSLLEPDGPATRDTRRIAFSIVGRGASALLRSFEGKELTVSRTRVTSARASTARAIYGALAELASEARSSEFRATRIKIAERAGVTSRTLSVYIREFERVGLVAVARRSRRADSVWRLLEVAGDARRETSSSAPSEWRNQRRQNGASGETSTLPHETGKKNIKEGNVIPFQKERSRRASAPGRFDHYDAVLRR